MADYTCAVCGGAYNEDDVMSTTCVECEQTVCIYCISYDGKQDTCDRCTDERVEAIGI